MTTRTRLNKALGKFGRLDAKSWRYKLIQLMGYLLYGRKIGYLSWWQHGSRTAGVIFTHKGKVLLGKRAHNIPDAPDTYGYVGGFIDGGETIRDGLVREIKEETGLELDASVFDRPPEHINETLGVNITEQTNIDLLSMLFVQELTAEQVAQIRPLDETAYYIWATLEDVIAYDEKGQMGFPHQVQRIKEMYAKGYIKA